MAKQTTVLAVLMRVARHNGQDVPCIFCPELDVKYGNIACYDNEGLNEASVDYYRSTRPAKTDEEKAVCRRLISFFNMLDPGEHTAARVIHRIPADMLRNHWVD